MLHKTSTKLTGVYLAILMAISLFFSANLYQLSVQEIDRGLRRGSPIQNLEAVPGLPSQLREQLRAGREEAFDEARQRVLVRLVFINLIILVGGGVLCYYLAHRTLRPIEEAHESLERFTADASHELRTPITAMRSENEVTLMDKNLSLKQAKEQIKSNIEELEKLTELSEGLLRLASGGNAELQKTELIVKEVVDRAASRVTTQIKAKKIVLSKKIQPNIKVVADEQSLIEALVVLLDNAAKYSPAKSKINVSAERKARTVIIRVTDSGVGIKASELPHIFERFYRADSSRTKQQTDGYGLGLAIAKSIIEGHDGTLSAESKSGKGSTFTITLPA